jgi:hypothetical protein
MESCLLRRARLELAIADCDIQSTPSCTELDLFEANSHAVQATVHTQRGLGGDGTCNQWGCTVNWGNFPTANPASGGQPTSQLYGPGAAGIDSTQPYTVVASMRTHGELAIELVQAGARVPFFNASSASNPGTGGCGGSCGSRDPPARTPTGVPGAASAASAAASAGGFVLVISLWGNADLGRWLDHECPRSNRKGVGSSQVIFRDMSLVSLPAHPAAPLPSPQQEPQAPPFHPPRLPPLFPPTDPHLPPAPAPSCPPSVPPPRSSSPTAPLPSFPSTPLRDNMALPTTTASLNAASGVAVPLGAAVAFALLGWWRMRGRQRPGRCPAACAISIGAGRTQERGALLRYPSVVENEMASADEAATQTHEKKEELCGQLGREAADRGELVTESADKAKGEIRV